MQWADPGVKPVVQPPPSVTTRSVLRVTAFGWLCVTCYSFWVVLCYVLQLLRGAVLRVTAFGWSCVSCYSFRVIARIGHFFFASGGVTDIALWVLATLLEGRQIS